MKKNEAPATTKKITLDSGGEKSDFLPYTDLDHSGIEKKLRTAQTGLPSAEATARQRQYGPNDVREQKTTTLTILVRQFRSSFVYLLIAAAGIAFLLGEFIDGGMILLFVLINASLGFYQEYHSEKTIKLLKKYTVQTAHVRRDNQERHVPTSELVPGDLVIFEAGDIIPADVRFVMDHDLVVNESVLTGESAPIRKTAQAIPATAEIYKAANIGFSGTSVVSGRAEAFVIAIGHSTVLGNLAHLTSETKRESTFEKGIGKFSNFILRMIVVTLVFLFVTNLAIKHGTVSVAELAVFSIALAVSVIPEALPVVTTFSLSRGALRLAKNHVVAKRLSAIEDLGSIEVLCTDKTGTLTKNQLRVAEVQSVDPQNTAFWSCLASSDETRHKTRQPNNAFDLAVWQYLSASQHKHLDEYTTLEEIPFDPERRRNSALVKHDRGHTLIVRGAPELILEFVADLSATEKSRLNDWLTREGKRGRRTIAVATKTMTGPAEYQPKDEESGLTWRGAISFVDPIKESTFSAVKKAKQLGVKIKILTGDSKEVAGAVAHEIGLIQTPDNVLTGEELFSLSAAEQLETVLTKSVFARVSPQQKYQIIHLLQQHHEIGFLGEGMNDAPALKIANVALVVQGASDIARDAADVVLLKQSLEVIIDGIREGREVFSNTIKYLKVTLASNFGNFYAIAVASLLINYLPMLPLQILLVNLLSDFPMITIAADATDDDELKRPKVYDVREVVLVATVLGAISSIFDFIFFAIFSTHNPETLYTYWFIGSILTELALIFCLRTRFPFLRAKRPAKIVAGLAVGAAVITVAIPFFHWAQRVFKFIEPEWPKLFLVFGIVAVYFALSEIVKHFYYRFHASAQSSNRA